MPLLWNENEVDVGQTVEFELGTLHAAVTRSEQDWTLEYRYDQDRYVRSSSMETVRIRSVYRETAPRLSLRPASASRNIVAMPTDTINIPASERATLFMSSPIWVQFLLHETETLLADLPVHILSDTWFGPNTREGELCFSNESSARIYLDRLPTRPERVITPVTFVNAGADPVTIDRLNLPLPLLSIFQTTSGFWTQEITIRREADLDEATVELSPSPPAQHPSAQLVAESRMSEDGGAITKALSMLFR